MGLADAISTVIRQTLRQFITPDRLRGRMTSINMIFFMGGPQLGELEAGFVASLFASAVLGVTVSVVSGGVATIVITAAVAAASPPSGATTSSRAPGGREASPRLLLDDPLAVEHSREPGARTSP